MPSALPLVSYDASSQTFSADANALGVLSAVPSPLAVVSIAGLFRTGKSFLLNRIILHAPTIGRRARKTPPSTGFGVGNTVQACTKGIWMWSEPLVVKNSQGENVNVIVLDTEGSGAPSADASHDARISSLGLLLSSYFVYNSVGRIDDSALSTLTTVTHVTSEMRAEDAGQLPGFLWVLRDFALQLTTADGSAVDPDTYMEEQLSGDKNDARAHLRRYFTDRGCATLIRPVTEESELQSLNDLGDSVLRPEFLESALALRNRILLSTANRPLRHNNINLSGGMMGALAVRYVEAVNAGAVPHIAEAWESVCLARAAEAEQSVMTTFPESVNALYHEACQVSHPLVCAFRTQLESVFTAAWAAYVHALPPHVQPRPELRDLLTERLETTVTRYKVSWTERVGNAAASLVSDLMASAHEYESWRAFWTGVQSRMQTFEETYGRDECTIYILLRAGQRLWDVVPTFLTDANLARMKDLEEQVVHKDAEVMQLRLDLEALTLRVQGADKRVEAMQDETEEMSRALTRAREEVRGMTEEVMEVTSMRTELDAMRTRVTQLEDALTVAEDEAMRKATETHATALNAVETIRELRDADSKRHEMEMADTKQALAKLQHEHDVATSRARGLNDKVAMLQQQVNDATATAADLTRELRTRDETARMTQTRMLELEKQIAEADERARKRPRVNEGDALALVRAETELGFLRTQKNELASTLTTTKARCTDLERQIRTVQRAADESVQRARLEHATEIAKLEMRMNKKE